MNDYSFLSHLRCSQCTKTYPTVGFYEKCQCGSILFAEYDLQTLKGQLAKEAISERPHNIWRYHELLPVSQPQSVVSLNEQITPLLSLQKTASDMDIPNLIVKDESTLPSATFKARGASIGISKAKELGASGVVIPTNGNAGAAWSLYAARAGIPMKVVMPTSAPIIPKKECVFSGANVYMVDGTIADAGQVARALAEKDGLYNVSTFNEPYRLEGKKTMGFEIAEQFGWSVPDVIVYPTGGGAGVVGIYKALAELQRLGWICDRFPRFALVQSVGCAPLVRAFELKALVSSLWENPETIAFGMRVPKSAADYLLLQIVRDTHGTAVSVNDEEIANERLHLIQSEGLHVCPEGAAAMAGTRKLRETGWIHKHETVLVINTGSGLKYTEQIPEEAYFL